MPVNLQFRNKSALHLQNVAAGSEDLKTLKQLGTWSSLVPCLVWGQREGMYHVGVVPAPRSSWGDNDVLMRSSPFQDGLDRAPWVVHVSAVAPVVARLTNGCVVRLQAKKCLFMSYNIMYGVIIQLIIIKKYSLYLFLSRHWSSMLRFKVGLKPMIIFLLAFSYFCKMHQLKEKHGWWLWLLWGPWSHCWSNEEVFYVIMRLWLAITV